MLKLYTTNTICQLVKQIEPSAIRKIYSQLNQSNKHDAGFVKMESTYILENNTAAYSSDFKMRLFTLRKLKPRERQDSPDNLAFTSDERKKLPCSAVSYCTDDSQTLGNQLGDERPSRRTLCFSSFFLFLFCFFIFLYTLIAFCCAVAEHLASVSVSQIYLMKR